MTERIVVSSDHTGFELKEAIKGFLNELGYQVEDVGTSNTNPVDYPKYTLKAAKKVSSGDYSRGIVFCGTGQGDAIVANKVVGIRAALCWDSLTAELSRSHNDANILVLGGWILEKRLATEIVRVWLTTPFAGGRHRRRLEQIKTLETNNCLHRRKTYDISLTIHPGMLVWPGDPPITIDTVTSIAMGDSSNVSLLHTGTHTATHIDAPRHFIPGSAGIDSTAPGVLMGPARLCQIAGVHHINRKVLEELELPGVTRLLLGTRNSVFIKKKQLELDYAFISEDAARYLVDIGIKLVGIDYLSIEEYSKEGHPAHNILLGAGVIIVEGLDLTEVPAGDYELICLPLKLKDGDGAPARVFLREV